MFSNRERGSVLVTDVVFGCFIVLIVSSVATAAGRVIDAGQSSREAARTSAVAIARGWDPEGALARARVLALPGSSIALDDVDGAVAVRVSVEIEVPHPLARGVRLPMEAYVSIPVAPYRSRRDG